jgi:CTP synthase
MKEWHDMLKRIDSREKTVRIALCGKYVKLHDAYLSVAEALRHAGYENKCFIDIKWVDTELITQYTVNDLLGDVDGILIPGGFGNRGVEGKITAAKFARENNIPFLGICLGMQVAVIEFARNVLGFADANSGEFAENSTHKVIDLMEEQINVESKGGTMRLGAYPCKVKQGTMLAKAYGKPEVAERHRHRYEFNNAFRRDFEENGMVISGTSPNGMLVEAVEIPANKFYVAVQYHPEFKSRPTNANPVFREFVRASFENMEEKEVQK